MQGASQLSLSLSNRQCTILQSLGAEARARKIDSLKITQRQVQTPVQLNQLKIYLDVISTIQFHLHLLASLEHLRTFFFLFFFLGSVGSSAFSASSFSWASIASRTCPAIQVFLNICKKHWKNTDPCTERKTKWKRNDGLKTSLTLQNLDRLSCLDLLGFCIPVPSAPWLPGSDPCWPCRCFAGCHAVDSWTLPTHFGHFTGI